jgi:hypothetical protein
LALAASEGGIRYAPGDGVMFATLPTLIISIATTVMPCTPAHVPDCAQRQVCLSEALVGHWELQEICGGFGGGCFDPRLNGDVSLLYLRDDGTIWMSMYGTESEGSYIVQSCATSPFEDLVHIATGEFNAPVTATLSPDGQVWSWESDCPDCFTSYYHRVAAVGVQKGSLATIKSRF